MVAAKRIIGVLVFFSVLAFSFAAEDLPYKEASFGDFVVKWRVLDKDLELSLSAPTTGWVAIGFNPSSRMKDANFVLGFVKDGAVSLSDEFGINFMAHKPDVELGGTSDVTSIGGSEANGRTQISFSIPLNSGDKYDQALEPGKEYPVIWAYGPNRADNFTTVHVRRGGGKIKI